MDAQSLVSPAVTLLVSVVGTGAVRAYALRSKLLDVANERSMHEVPTPRGGGLAIVVAFFVGLAYLAVVHRVSLHLAAAFAVGGIPIAAIGWMDDRKHVSSALRLAIHIACCLAALMIASPRAILPEALTPVWVWPILAVAMAWCVNLYNFMDGLDGFSASEGVFVGVAGAFLLAAFASSSAIALLVAAGCLGFLVWNWPPAKIFMGDAGSGFLGFCFAMLAVVTSKGGGLIVWPALLSVFVCDATITLITRFARKEAWTKPHNTHAFQVLAKQFGHRTVTVGLAVVNLAIALPVAYFALNRSSGWTILAGLLICGAVMVAWVRRVNYSLPSGEARPALDIQA